MPQRAALSAVPPVAAGAGPATAAPRGRPPSAAPRAHPVTPVREPVDEVDEIDEIVAPLDEPDESDGSDGSDGSDAPEDIEGEAGADPARGLGPPAPRGCVTLSVDESDRVCVLRLRGPLGRGAIARVDAVLHAVEPMTRALVVDVSRARTRDRRLLRVLADVCVRRQRAGRHLTLRGVHAGVVPDLEAATLPEAFLVYRAVCGPAV